MDGGCPCLWDTLISNLHQGPADASVERGLLFCRAPPAGPWTASIVCLIDRQ